MLDDKDRIFLNLYGFHDAGLAGARSRGTWDGTKSFIDKGHDFIIDRRHNRPSVSRHMSVTGG